MKHFRTCFFALFLGCCLCHMQEAYGFRFVVYGDSYGSETSGINRTVLGYINSKIAHLNPKPEFVFFLGDCVRPAWSGTYRSHNNLADWKAFMKQGLGKIPFYVSIGNNDMYGGDDPLHRWTEYPLQAQFQSTLDDSPSNGPHNYKHLAYSFEHGKGKESCFFVVLDTFGFYLQNGSYVNFDNGLDQEQLNWFEKQAKRSDAHFKFVLTHGPAFSIEGWPVGSSLHTVWDIMGENHFDGFYCAHEHIFSRWLITKAVYPEARRTMVQTIVGSAGSYLDDMARIRVNMHDAHVFHGFTYIVVDVEGDQVTQTCYGLVPSGSSYTTRRVDRYIYRK